MQDIDLRIWPSIIRGRQAVSNGDPQHHPRATGGQRRLGTLQNVPKIEGQVTELVLRVFDHSQSVSFWVTWCCVFVWLWSYWSIWPRSNFVLLGHLVLCVCVTVVIFEYLTVSRSYWSVGIWSDTPIRVLGYGQILLLECWDMVKYSNWSVEIWSNTPIRVLGYGQILLLECWDMVKYSY